MASKNEGATEHCRLGMVEAPLEPHRVFIAHPVERLVRALTDTGLNQIAHMTGTNVSVRSNAPTSAMATVSAMGLKSFPDGPVSA